MIYCESQGWGIVCFCVPADGKLTAKKQKMTNPWGYGQGGGGADGYSWNWTIHYSNCISIGAASKILVCPIELIILINTYHMTNRGRWWIFSLEVKWNVKDILINKSKAWNKEKIWNENHDLPKSRKEDLSSVKKHFSPWVLVAQLTEHPARKFMGLISIRHSDFSLCPSFAHDCYYIFYLSLIRVTS